MTMIEFFGLTAIILTGAYIGFRAYMKKKGQK